jgi:exopolysaccharide biosynthesis polyprenyl glycosylphosphotransferase
MQAPPATGRSGYEKTAHGPVAAFEAVESFGQKMEGPAASASHVRGWLVRRALLAADMVGLIASLFLSQALFTSKNGGFVARLTPSPKWLFFVAALPAWVVAAKLYKLYDRDEERTDHSTVDDVVGVFHLVTVSVWIAYGVGRATGLFTPDLVKATAFWLFAIFLIPLARSAARAICRRRREYIQNTIIVGAGHIGQLIARKYLQHPEYGIRLVGFVDEQPRERRDDLGDLIMLGAPRDLAELVEAHSVDRVVIAFSNEPTAGLLDLVRSLRESNVQIDVVPRLFEVVPPNVGVHSVEGLPLVNLPPFRMARSSLLLKRTLDVLVSLTALFLLLPVFAVVAVLIKLDSRGPVFFRQTRMGANDKTFAMLKFRTMVVDADERKHEVAHLNRHLRPGGDSRMFKVPDDPRVTRVGRVLRRYSIDELPQLINVLRDEMSLVGPRPLILAEDEHVLDWARSRVRLQPGITGPWQVLGRANIPFQEMVTLDYFYVTSWSMLNDLKLLLQTVPAVARTRADA